MNFRIPFPKLSPLQARLAASFCATMVLVAVWFIATLPNTAYSQSLPKARQPIARQGAHDVFFDFITDIDDEDEYQRGDGIAGGHGMEGEYRPLEIENHLSQHALGPVFNPLDDGEPDVDLDGHEAMGG